MGKDGTAKDDENQEQSHKFGINLFLLIGCIALLVIIIFLLSIHLGSPNDGGAASFFSYSKADLGTLGDLLGGTLNPILSFATICLLVWSIQIQISELKETRKEMARSSDALENTNKIHQENLQSQERNILIPIALPKFEDLISAVYTIYSEKITIKFHAEYNMPVGQAGLRASNCIGPSVRQIAEGLRKGKLVNEMLMKRTDPPQNDDAIPQVINRIEMLVNNLHEILRLVRALERINADKFLYFDDFIQARLICIELQNVAKTIAPKTATKLRMSELCEGFIEVSSVSISSTPSPSSIKKPFKVILLFLEEKD